MKKNVIILTSLLIMLMATLTAHATTEDKTQLIVITGQIDANMEILSPFTILIELNGRQISIEVKDQNNYAATFMVFEGYVAGVGDTVKVTVEKRKELVGSILLN